LDAQAQRGPTVNLRWTKSSSVRSALALAAMSLAVMLVYWPPPPEESVPDALVGMSGSDFNEMHVTRLRYAREALFGPQHFLPGWYTRELGGTPFWSDIPNFPFIPPRWPLLL